MCGIVGNYSAEGKIDKELLIRARDLISHRGPDDSDVFIDKNIGFGHRRLSIIDLSSAGHQPMSNEDGTIWIIFNGEIYNYRELIPELKKAGHRFRSQSDTEAIIHAYEEYGEKCLEKFNGMWAFAIWDSKKKKLFLSRDRMGVKPLYYHWDAKKGKLIFASEIKSILAFFNRRPKPNNKIIYQYLAFGLLDYSDETFFEDIKQLPPAHFATLLGKKFEIERYWNLNPDKKTIFRNDEDYARNFYKLFEDAIRLRLRSDVPVGTCLSGGLDSSSIVCVANNLLRKEGIKSLGRKQKTFSSCFENKKYDERDFINMVIKKTGVSNFRVFPNPKILFKEMEKLVWHQDEPFGSTSIYAQWNVFKLAHQKGMKVMLDGQGADELLAGYHGYFGSFLASLLTNMRFVSLAKELKEFSLKHGQSKSAMFRNLIYQFLPAAIIRTLARKKIIGQNNVLDSKFADEFGDSLPYENYYRDKFKNHLYNLFTKLSLPALLHYEDRDSMAFSIESRVPFLDYRLVEFIFSLPNNQIIRDGTTKFILRNSMKKILPEKIRTRMDKMGFVTPEDIWFRTILKEDILKIFNSKSFKKRKYFNVKKVLEEFEKHCQGKINISFAIWRWINLELWFRGFVD